jgi:hypothetical protein
MLFGRAFENALAAYFRREDSAATLFQEWQACRQSNLTYSNGVTWDRMLQQGVQLLDRFAARGSNPHSPATTQSPNQVHEVGITG